MAEKERFPLPPPKTKEDLHARRSRQNNNYQIGTRADRFPSADQSTDWRPSRLFTLNRRTTTVF